MAERLASFIGREKDRECFYYFKVGACRHGARCTRRHTLPSISRILLFPKMYRCPDIVTRGVANRPNGPQEHFENYFERWHKKLSEYGRIQRLYVCDNSIRHLDGHVYVQFKEARHAADALRHLKRGFFNGIILFSPVTDLRQSRCRDHKNNNCSRGSNCNFMHLKKISRDLQMRLFIQHHRRHDRTRSPHKHQSHEDRPHVGRRYGRHNDDRDRYHEERGTRHRSRSRGFKRERSRSPRGRRNRSPEKGGRVERRAKTERGTRHRSRSRGFKRERSRSPRERRNTSAEEGGRVERRAKTERGTRHRSRSPGFKRERSRSPRGRRNRSPER